MNTLVVSDLHIGDNSRTCWYQQSVHEPYLFALLDWVIQNTTQKNPPIDRLIILGDLFDFWTYIPDRRPPTIDDILAANPNLFGPAGKMRQVMDALNGNVLYVHGNHDITITQVDLDRIPTGANKIRLVDDIFYDSDRIVYTHGHLFTMFNAPDPRYPGEVPVGHFVTRAVSYYVNNSLQGNQTAADLHDQGSPYGFNLKSLLPGLSTQFSNPSVTNLLLDYIATRTGLAQDHPIMMADGSVTCIADVKVKYDYLWTDWATLNGGGQFGETVAAKAAQADYDGSYMAWFAQMVAMQNGALGTVMGHTHIPKVGIEHSSYRYVNNGFECPSIPDINAGQTHFNFTLVDSNSNPQLWQVAQNGGAFNISQTSAPQDQTIYAPFMDFSCYVRIANNSGSELVKQAQLAKNGHYVVPPPNRIPASTTVDIWLQDLAGFNGAEGSVTYSQADGSGRMDFTYGCPTGLSANYASGGAEFIATSTNPPTGRNTPRNQVPPLGHPLYVQFFVQPGARISRGNVVLNGNVLSRAGIARMGPGIAWPGGVILGTPVVTTPWAPTSLLAKAVYAAGFLYDPGQDIIYSRMDPLQRQFGYAYGYDAAALGMNAVLDCEPIFFDYAGKHWMIELWKGQYGLETGCEIGVYNRVIGSTSPVYAMLDAAVGRRDNDATPSHNLFFDCANDNELLEMSSTLYRNGQKLFSRGPEKHWWLTGFKWGVFSHPEDLSMDVSITCLDATMTAAFVYALRAVGYNPTVTGNNVRFSFGAPHTYQPRTAAPVIVQGVYANDQTIVNSYNALGFPNNDPNTIPDTAYSLIMNSVSIYEVDFFAQAAANGARAAALDAYTVISALAQEFQMGVDVATDFAEQAGYTLSNWVGSVETVLGIDLNFSCVVEISNRGGPYDLILEDHRINQGNYAVRPPDRISAGRVGRFWLKDPKPSPFGADGWAQYYYIDSGNNRHSVRFTYACPTGWSPNVASTQPPFNFYTKSGSVNSGWSAVNQVITGGHPLYVAFVWGNGPAPA